MTSNSNCHTTTLILGGARSGKSRLAHALAETARSQRVFVATAEALDAEMTERIRRHQCERNASWETAESPLELCAAIERFCERDCAIVVDCMTLWLSNLLHAGRDIDAETGQFVTTITTSTAPLFIVSNEVGLGIVPETKLGREFRDLQGRLNQELARACDCVEFIAAGLPLRLKG